jgi:iron-sulfur cluster assembly protein
METAVGGPTATTGRGPSSPAVTLTAEAIKQAKRLVQRHGDPNAFLRLGLRGGGCSGFSYVLRVDTKPLARDEVYEFEGLKVAIDPKSLRYMAGTVLEYTGNLMMPGGFEFQNPNAGKSCGCGLSFAAKSEPRLGEE